MQPESASPVAHLSSARTTKSSTVSPSSPSPTPALKATKPDFVTAPWTTGPGRWWHWMAAPGAEGSDAMHRVLDAPFLELLWDFPPDQSSNLLPAFTCRYYRGLCGDRPAWILPYLC